MLHYVSMATFSACSVTNEVGENAVYLGLEHKPLNYHHSNGQ